MFRDEMESLKGLSDTDAAAVSRQGSKPTNKSPKKTRPKVKSKRLRTKQRRFRKYLLSRRLRGRSRDDNDDEDMDVTNQYLLVLLFKCLLWDPMMQCVDALLETVFEPVLDCLSHSRSRTFRYRFFTRNIGIFQILFGWKVPSFLVYISMLVVALCVCPAVLFLIIGTVLIIVSLEHIADLGPKTLVAGAICLGLGFAWIVLSAISWFAAVATWKAANGEESGMIPLETKSTEETFKQSRALLMDEDGSSGRDEFELRMESDEESNAMSLLDED